MQIVSDVIQIYPIKFFNSFQQSVYQTQVDNFTNWKGFKSYIGWIRIGYYTDSGMIRTISVWFGLKSYPKLSPGCFTDLEITKSHTFYVEFFFKTVKFSLKRRQNSSRGKWRNEIKARFEKWMAWRLWVVSGLDMRCYLIWWEASTDMYTMLYSKDYYSLDKLLCWRLSPIIMGQKTQICPYMWILVGTVPANYLEIEAMPFDADWHRASYLQLLLLREYHHPCLKFYFAGIVFLQ